MMVDLCSSHQAVPNPEQTSHPEKTDKLRIISKYFRFHTDNTAPENIDKNKSDSNQTDFVSNNEDSVRFEYRFSSDDKEQSTGAHGKRKHISCISQISLPSDVTRLGKGAPLKIGGSATSRHLSTSEDTGSLPLLFRGCIGRVRVNTKVTCVKYAFKPKYF